MVLISSTHSSIGKLQDLQHILHDVLAIAANDDIILLVKQENIQSAEELTLLVLSTDWGEVLSSLWEECQGHYETCQEATLSS